MLYTNYCVPDNKNPSQNWRILFIFREYKFWRGENKGPKQSYCRFERTIILRASDKRPIIEINYKSVKYKAGLREGDMYFALNCILSHDVCIITNLLLLLHVSIDIRNISTVFTLACHKNFFTRLNDFKV